MDELAFMERGNQLVRDAHLQGFVLAESPDGGGNDGPPDASERGAFLLQDRSASDRHEPSPGPNGLIYLAYVGAVLLAVGVLVLGVGLVRRPAQVS